MVKWNASKNQKINSSISPESAKDLKVGVVPNYYMRIQSNMHQKTKLIPADDVRSLDCMVELRLRLMDQWWRINPNFVRKKLGSLKLNVTNVKFGFSMNLLLLVLVVLVEWRSACILFEVFLDLMDGFHCFQRPVLQLESIDSYCLKLEWKLEPRMCRSHCDVHWLSLNAWVVDLVVEKGLFVESWRQYLNNKRNNKFGTEYSKFQSKPFSGPFSVAVDSDGLNGLWPGRWWNESELCERRSLIRIRSGRVDARGDKAVLPFINTKVQIISFFFKNFEQFVEFLFTLFGINHSGIGPVCDCDWIRICWSWCKNCRLLVNGVTTRKRPFRASKPLE